MILLTIPVFDFPVGAAFGKGVYFARDAAYSYIYAARSGASVGNRCMYLSRVLVGQYCKGNEDMIVPPAKKPFTARNFV